MSVIFLLKYYVTHLEHLASCTMGARSLSWGQAVGTVHNYDHPSSSRALASMGSYVCTSALHPLGL